MIDESFENHSQHANPLFRFQTQTLSHSFIHSFTSCLTNTPWKMKHLQSFPSSRHRDRTDTTILCFLSMTSENDIARIAHHRKQLAHDRHHRFLVLLAHTAAELQWFVELFPRERKRPCQKDASLRDRDGRDLERFVFYHSRRHRGHYSYTHRWEAIGSWNRGKNALHCRESSRPRCMENRAKVGSPKRSRDRREKTESPEVNRYHW